MIKFNQIKSLQLEISNYCNAACPQCPRNYYGGKTIPTLPLKKWTTSEFKRIFTHALLEQLEQVYFCGTYGDPMTNKNILQMCKFLKSSNNKIKIGIHTNGSVGRDDLYKKLASVTDFIAFGIDGLENTNHIYRRQTNWNKIIKNSSSYIDAGGYAIWDFIVFKHNEHQVEGANLYSQSLGFKEFNIKKTSRFLNRTHEYSEKLYVYNKNNTIDYTIQLPTDSKFINDGYKPIILKKDNLRDYAKTTVINCNSKKISEAYIGAEGFVFPCGWLHDRLYGPEAISHADHARLIHLIDTAGGWENISIFHKDLEYVMDHWFPIIEESWQSCNQLERCGIMCGEEINLIKSQNKDIRYKS